MNPFDKELLLYAEHYSSPEDTVLQELSRRTHLQTLYPQMMSGTLQGRLLQFISRMIRPRHILEIGTFTGYSALCLVKGLRKDGKLTTLESNDEYESIIREFFGKAGVTDRIELILGNALEILPHLHGPFDLVFIDADKREYADYYEKVIDKVTPDGIILTDNVLWDGKVLKKEDGMDEETLAIHRFNRMVTEDERVENFILPIRDGLMVIRKK